MKSSISSPLCWVFALIFCFSANALHGQKWDKYFDKSKDAYEIGDYAKSNKFIDKAIKKSKKKLGDENLILANALLQKAKFSIAYGVYEGVPEQIALAIKWARP